MYRRPSLFAGVKFQENAANTKTANTKSNKNLKTGVPFLISIPKWKKTYTKTQFLLFLLMEKQEIVKLGNFVQQHSSINLSQIFETVFAV